MDATGIASAAAAVGFGGTLARHVWRRVDEDRQARAAARQRADWRRRVEAEERRQAAALAEAAPRTAWEAEHGVCARVRAAGGCVGLSRTEQELVPDYVPAGVVAAVLRPQPVDRP